MKKIKVKTSMILLLVSVLGIVALVSLAQPSDGDNFDDNRNIARIFRLINSLNKEAEKQQAKGFEKRAERLKNYFQKKTGISNEASLKLNELAVNFAKETESLNAQIKEIRKNQKNKPNDGALPSELAKLRESQNKFFDSARQSLNNEIATDDSEKVLKFLREWILEKIKNKSKARPKGNLLKQEEVFQKISSDNTNEAVFDTYLEGYSWIDYNPETNELWTSSVTNGTCEFIDLDHEQEEGCSSTYVHSILSDPNGTTLATETFYIAGSVVESNLYATPVITGQYCVDAEHQIEDLQYNVLYSQSWDCMGVALIDKIQYQIPNTSDYANIDDTLYVLKGTTVNFKAATQSDDGIEGNWSGTSGVSGRGETASATFNNVSSGLTDYKTVIVGNGSNQKTVNVIVYELTGILTPQDNFANRTQAAYGVSEKVDLSFTANPAVTAEQIGGLEWKRISGSGFIENNADNPGIGTFTAPDTASSESIKLEVTEGASKGQGVSYNKSVVAPSSAVAVQDTTVGNVVHTQGMCSVGFYLTVYLRPTNVSFREIRFYEDEVLPTLATGYYLGNANENHPRGAEFDVLGGNFATGNKVNWTDNPLTEGNPPCASGEFIWDIPWKYIANSANTSGHLFYTARHRQFIPSYNVVSIEKAGVGPFTKAVSDPSSY
jgi:hypothetical protein